MSTSDANIEKFFTKLEEEVRRLDDSFLTLQNLQTKMQENFNHFTAQEHESVKEKLQQITHDREQKTNSFSQKLDLYSSKVICLRETLTTREQILETVPEEHGDLLDRFAEQQAQMQEELDDALVSLGMSASAYQNK